MSFSKVQGCCAPLSTLSALACQRRQISDVYSSLSRHGTQVHPTSSMPPAELVTPSPPPKTVPVAVPLWHSAAPATTAACAAAGLIAKAVATSSRAPALQPPPPLRPPRHLRFWQTQCPAPPMSLPRLPLMRAFNVAEAADAPAPSPQQCPPPRPAMHHPPPPSATLRPPPPQRNARGPELGVFPCALNRTPNMRDMLALLPDRPIIADS